MNVQLSAQEQSDSGELKSLLTQKGADGRRVFSNADIKHFVPLAVLHGGVKLDDFPSLKAIMIEFIAKLALPSVITPESFARAVHTYYRTRPGHRELERQFFAFCRAHTRGKQLDAKQVAKYTKVANVSAATPPAQAAMRLPTAVSLWGTIRKIARNMS